MGYTKMLTLKERRDNFCHKIFANNQASLKFKELLSNETLSNYELITIVRLIVLRTLSHRNVLLETIEDNFLTFK